MSDLKAPNIIKKIKLPESDNVVNIKGLRKYHLPYIFIWIVYYAWVISFTTWWTASPTNENVFGTELRSLMHSVNLLSSAVFILLFKKEWFVKTARIGALGVILGIALFLLADIPALKLLFIIFTGIALGSVNTSILMPFVFTLNNTEKLLSVVASNAFISLISLFHEAHSESFLSSNTELALSVAMLITGFGAVLFFRNSEVDSMSDESNIIIPEFQPRVYLTIFFNCIIAILCKGVGKAILNITVENYKLPVLIWYYIGGLFGCVLFVLVYAYTKKAFVWLANITFGSLAMGLFCNAFVGQLQSLAILFAVLLGIGSTVGMINMYYIIGVVGKKYNSMKYLRLSIILIGICGGVSGVVLGNLINSINTTEVSIIASILSSGTMVLLLMYSPKMFQTSYYEDWAKDSEKIEIDNEQNFIFKKYGFSKREMEVCKLLLQGNTMRQISGILSIGYSTVNTYCTSVYRKLEINSRTELLLLFKDYNIK